MNYNIDDTEMLDDGILCEPVAQYSSNAHERVRELGLFDSAQLDIDKGDIKVVELFAGVGGFRIGLERASKHFKTIWSNQWEPSTKRQDASIIYCRHFGIDGHSNEDIATVLDDAVRLLDVL